MHHCARCTLELLRDFYCAIAEPITDKMKGRAAKSTHGVTLEEREHPMEVPGRIAEGADSVTLVLDTHTEAPSRASHEESHPQGTQTLLPRTEPWFPPHEFLGLFSALTSLSTPFPLCRHLKHCTHTRTHTSTYFLKLQGLLNG